MATMIKCPFCGGLVDAASDICIHCGGPLKSKSAQPSAARAASMQCPACSAPVGPGDIVCVKCGTNLLTGQKVAEQKKEAGRPRFAGVLRLLGYIAGGVVALAAVGGLVVLAMYFLQDPVGEARRLAAGGNLAEATELLQQHLEKAPEDLDGQFLLGKICWQGQQYERASEIFESVARQGGPLERDALVLALLASERSPNAENRQRLVTLMGTVVQQRYANDPELQKLLALARGAVGEYKGEREALTEATTLGSEISPALPGLAMALDNDLAAAEQSLAKALETHPGDISASAAQGLVLLMGGREDEALPLLEAAVDSPAEISGPLQLQIGLLYLRRGEAGKALSLVTNAKKLMPEDVRTDFFHALCLQENKLLPEALTAFERISSGTSAYAGQAALQMALAFMDQDNLDRAAAMVRQAGEAGLNTARQATIQGRIFARQNDLAQAEQAYRRAVSMMPDYPAARLELGLLLINRGAIDAGLQELDYYLELAKQDPQRMRANEIEVLVTQIRQSRQ